ncbi:hypothetical protein EI94DRAFT_1790146 [Lactarius quietus]|nr:hypothetical protein EI94DRAFT_1790146 [Lactarius quietus]
MLFYKSLVSFVTAIALAGSVTASAVPERRQTTQSCSTGSLTCCVTSSPFTGLSEAIQEGLLALLDPDFNINLPVGLGCVAAGVLGCNNDAFCCDGTQNLNGLINIGLNCVNLPL